MVQSLPQLVAHYGYAVVAVLVGAEGLGLPLPGETALITGAILAAQGRLWLPMVILASALGVAVGGAGGYWIGRTAGQAVVTRYGRWVGITPAAVEHARRFFARRGSLAVVVGRFLPVIRILTGVVAGLTDMPFGRFTVFNAIAGVLWSVAYGVLGYVFGRNLSRFEHRFGPAGVVVIGVLVVAGIATLK